MASVVDTFQVTTNFQIGRRIVEHEQKGAKRAAYGKDLLLEVCGRLAQAFGHRFSPVNLSYMKRCYLLWRDRVPIFQTPSEKLVAEQIFQTSSDKLANMTLLQPLPAQFAKPFTLIWSQHV